MYIIKGSTRKTEFLLVIYVCIHTERETHTHTEGERDLLQVLPSCNCGNWLNSIPKAIIWMSCWSLKPLYRWLEWEEWCNMGEIKSMVEPPGMTWSFMMMDSWTYVNSCCLWTGWWGHPAETGTHTPGTKHMHLTQGKRLQEYPGQSGAAAGPAALSGSQDESTDGQQVGKVGYRTSRQ